MKANAHRLEPFSPDRWSASAPDRGCVSSPPCAGAKAEARVKILPRKRFSLGGQKPAWLSAALRNHLYGAVHPEDTVEKMAAFETVGSRRTRHECEFDRLV
jgi:hypothetical protein